MNEVDHLYDHTYERAVFDKDPLRKDKGKKATSENATTASSHPGLLIILKRVYSRANAHNVARAAITQNPANNDGLRSWAWYPACSAMSPGDRTEGSRRAWPVIEQREYKNLFDWLFVQRWEWDTHIRSMRSRNTTNRESDTRSPPISKIIST